MCCIRTVEHYSATKRNAVVIHTTTWINLEDMRSERRQLHKKPHILYDSIYMKCPEQADLQKQEVG